MPSLRLLYAALSITLLAAAAAVAAATGAWWLLATGLLAPDLALLAGAAPDLAPGQLHPRGVAVYNAVHRFWGPAAVVTFVPVLGLAWAAHVAVDRAVGYGLRDARGFQRAG